MPQNKNYPFDVIVVGSGSSGGWACKRLAEARLKVALLEAGRPQADRNFTEHKPALNSNTATARLKSSAKRGPSKSNSVFATNIRTNGLPTISTSPTQRPLTSLSIGWGAFE